VPNSRLEARRDLAGLGPAAFCLLGEDHTSVGHDVELASQALGDRRVVSLLTKLGCETRSPFVVSASDGAVQDADDGHEANVALVRRQTSKQAR